MAGRLFLLLTMVLLTQEVQMANILALLPMPFYSHTINFMPIFKELAARGHNVTVVSPFPQKAPLPNLTDIVTEGNDLSRALSKISAGILSERFFQLELVWLIGSAISEAALKHEIIQELFKDNDTKFDLIMIETFIFQEALLAFGYKFNAPVINLHPGILTASAAYYTGNSIPFSYAPTRFSSFSDHMTFIERVETSFFHSYDLLITKFYWLSQQDNLMQKYLQHPGLPKLPPLSDMLKNTSLTLINHNSAIGYPYPAHTNIVEIGGINVKKGEKLPADLEEMMDQASEGVVYFSFGTVLNLTSLSPAVRSTILTVLGQLQEKVLIKWDRIPYKEKFPKNLEFRTWYPQAGILAHPKCKLFITHGGSASLMESVYHKVPMLLIPVVGDQMYNAKFAEINGIGETVHFADINEVTLNNAINTIIHDSRYKENIVKRSAIFHDQPVKTLDNAIYWIEYVIRHKGAPHLRPAVLDLHLFQVFMLDVIAFYLFILIIIIFIVKMVMFQIFKSIKLFVWKQQCANKAKKE